MVVRNNPDNPYHEPAYKVVGCDYCKVHAGELCVVRWSGRHTQGLEDHEARPIARRAAYDAWELGHKTGLLEGRQQVVDAIENVLSVTKIVGENQANLKSVG